MAERRSILANLAALATGQVIALALGLVTHAILARAVGPADYGILGFAVAVMSYFGIAASLGTDTWAMREIAQDRTRVHDIVATVLGLRLALAVLAFVGVVVLLLLWDRAAPTGVVILIQSASLLTAAITLDFAFQGLERMDAVARRQVTTALIALAGVAAALGLGGGIVAAAAVLQAAALAAALVMLGEFAAAHGFALAATAWSRILRESAPLAVTGIVVSVYASIDIVMLGFMKPGDEVGFYVAAVRLMMIGLAVVAVFRTAFSPVLARLMADAPARREAGAHHARAVMATGGLGAVLGFVLAPEVLTLVFGAAFAPASTVLRILMANLLIAFAVEIFHTQLVAWRLQTEQMWIMIVGALANIMLNVVLIPTYGMEGAAAATLLSTVLILALAAIVLGRYGFEVHAGPIVQTVGLAGLVAALGLAAGGMMAGGGMLLRLTVLCALLSAIYLAAAWLMGMLRPQQTLDYLTRRA